MSTDADQPKPEQRRAALFDEQELPIPAARSEEVAGGVSAAARVMSPQRDQVELRACDLVSLKVRDVSHGERVASRATVPQKKTKRPVQFEITAPAREAAEAWIREAGLRGEDYLFPSRTHNSPHICTRQYARMLREWLQDIGLDWHDYGTHSMRRTKATLIYRKTKNLRAVQLLLGHSDIASTVRYLGIEVDDALEISEQVEI